MGRPQQAFLRISVFFFTSFLARDWMRFLWKTVPIFNWNLIAQEIFFISLTTVEKKKKRKEKTNPSAPYLLWRLVSQERRRAPSHFARLTVDSHRFPTHLQLHRRMRRNLTRFVLPRKKRQPQKRCFGTDLELQLNSSRRSCAEVKRETDFWVSLLDRRWKGSQQVILLKEESATHCSCS